MKLFKGKKDNKTKKMEEIILEFFNKMGFTVEIEIKDISENEKLVFNVKTSESGFLIGQYGSNLDAIEQLLRIIMKKKFEERPMFFIDINSYREEKDRAIVSLAKDMAKRALIEKRAVVLRPMTSYERRLIHMELAENSSVITESTGEGEERKVIIKPEGLV